MILAEITMSSIGVKLVNFVFVVIIQPYRREVVVLVIPLHIQGRIGRGGIEIVLGAADGLSARPVPINYLTVETSHLDDRRCVGCSRGADWGEVPSIFPGVISCACSNASQKSLYSIIDLFPIFTGYFNSRNFGSVMKH